MIPLDDFQVEAGRAGFPAAERYAGGAFSVLPAPDYRTLPAETCLSGYSDTGGLFPALILMEAIDAGLPDSAGIGAAAVLPFFIHVLMGRRRTIKEG